MVNYKRKYAICNQRLKRVRLQLSELQQRIVREDIIKYPIPRSMEDLHRLANEERVVKIPATLLLRMVNLLSDAHDKLTNDPMSRNLCCNIAAVLPGPE